MRKIKCHKMYFLLLTSPRSFQWRRTNSDVDRNANLKSPLSEIQRYQALEQWGISSFPLIGSTDYLEGEVVISTNSV
jgi:hypothetical protein